MAEDVDAVIAALRVVLQEVERREWQERFEVHVVNDWIGQPPGAWWAKWRRLKLKPRWDTDSTGLSATRAYAPVATKASVNVDARGSNACGTTPRLPINWTAAPPSARNACEG